jgi:WD40 repeat protein
MISISTLLYIALMIAHISCFAAEEQKLNPYASAFLITRKYSFDGSKVLTTAPSQDGLIIGTDKTIQVLKKLGLESIQNLEHPVSSLSITPDGHIYIGSFSGDIFKFHPKEPNSETIFSNNGDETIRLLSTQKKGDETHVLCVQQRNEKRLTSIDKKGACINIGMPEKIKLLHSCKKNPELFFLITETGKIYQIKSTNELYPINPDESYKVSSFFEMPDGESLFTGDKEGMMRAYNTNNTVKSAYINNSGILAIGGNKSILAAASNNASVSIVDPNTLAILATYWPSTQPITQIANYTDTEMALTNGSVIHVYDFAPCLDLKKFIEENQTNSSYATLFTAIASHLKNNKDKAFTLEPGMAQALDRLPENIKTILGKVIEQKI